MPKLGDLIAKQFKKLNIEITDVLKPLTEIETEVPQETADQMETGLLTVASAKSNPEVNKALRAQILNSVDARVDAIIGTLAMQPGEDFLAIKNSYERLDALANLALETGKKTTGKPDEKAAEKWAKQEADLRRQLKEAIDKNGELETSHKGTLKTQLTEFELQKILLGKEFVFPKEMDRNLQVTTALGVVNNNLAKEGFKLVLGENGILSIVNAEGQPAYSKTNEAIEPNTYIESVLAQSNLLKKSDPSPQPPSPGPIVPTPGAGAPGNPAVQAEIQAQIAAIV